MCFSGMTSPDQQAIPVSWQIDLLTALVPLHETYHSQVLLRFLAELPLLQLFICTSSSWHVYEEGGCPIALVYSAMRSIARSATYSLQ